MEWWGCDGGDLQNFFVSFFLLIFQSIISKAYLIYWHAVGGIVGVVDTYDSVRMRIVYLLWIGEICIDLKARGKEHSRSSVKANALYYLWVERSERLRDFAYVLLPRIPFQSRSNSLVRLLDIHKTEAFVFLADSKWIHDTL